MRIIRLLTIRALAWVSENCHFEAWQILPGNSIACDYRMSLDIEEAMKEAGLISGEDYTM